MEVIQFPGAATRSAPGAKKIEGTVPNHKLLVGTVQVTCTSCRATSQVTTNGAVFRTIELYCNQCGTYHKLTNPAFAIAPAPKRK